MIFSKQTVQAAIVSTALLVQGLAYAIPSYTRQTGDSCGSCHVGAFGPQLTPHGIAFKLGGYTDSNGSKTLPLSGMITANVTKTAKDVDEPIEHYNANNNATLQEFSAFVAGAVTKNIGVFSQITYSGVERKTSLDHFDVRYARELTQADGKTAVAGVSFNNHPAVQDVFNSLGAWSYPYLSADLAPSPDANVLLEGERVAGTIAGLTGYTLLGNGIYLEAGAYTNQNAKFLDKVQNIQADSRLHGLSPYARVAYYKDNHASNYSVGLVGMTASVKPIEGDQSSDKFTDVGVDANYQFLGDRRNVCGASFSYIYEKQDLQNTFAAGGAESAKANLRSAKLSSSYYFDQTYGVTAGYFDKRGSADSLLYAANESKTPDSSGYIVQADWTPWGKDSSWMAPWANVRLGLQYTGYTKFNGAANNYDGNGRNASDNNTIMGFVWTAW